MFYRCDADDVVVVVVFDIFNFVTSEVVSCCVGLCGKRKKGLPKEMGM